MGRKKMNKVPICRSILDDALKRNDMSINKLGMDPFIGATRKTIERALRDELINPEILARIGERLDVDPHWLTGQDLRLMTIIQKNAEYCKVENHPYNKTKEQRKGINFSQHFQELLVLHGISIEQFNSLPEKTQHGFEMELDLVIQMVIFKYFSQCTNSDDAFLCNQELHKMSCDVLAGDTYDKLFELLEA